ncbi:MAG: hypothetical protein C0518_00610 [Opitutus sp.]|nr:hypothetical protein [Opitutus sp.]
MNLPDFHQRPLAVTRADVPKLMGWQVTLPECRTPLDAWDMQRDDAPLLRSLFSSFRPRRHLEFGTWQGFGTCLCLESCDATVWTINLPDGETKSDGSWAYGERVVDEKLSPPGAIAANYGVDELGPRTYHRTDAASYIGRLYRERGFGHRVCQIYCDTRQWDNSNYPAGFFDSAFIDGGHAPEVVASDSRKALQSVRSGGLMLWHDFCPAPETRDFDSVRGVQDGLAFVWPELSSQLQYCFWINPSWLLMGIKR